jgi:hypothetical protein
MKTREEQLTWAKQRALICVDMGRFSDAVAGLCAIVFAHACKLGLEGIVSKRASSLYLQRGQSALQRLTDKPSLLIGYSIERLDGLRRRAAPSLNLRHGR